MKSSISSGDIAILCPYPKNLAPGQRFRQELFFPVVEMHDVPEYSFWTRTSALGLYKKRSSVIKLWWLILGYLRRLSHLWKIRNRSYIFIYREVTPLGPPIFEYVLTKVFGKRLIYDLDDAIWIPTTSEVNRIASRLKNPGKVAKIMRWSWAVTAGNSFLADYAKKYNRNVHVIPTVVDTERRHNRMKNQDGSEVVVGWTGSHSTLKYLNKLLPVLLELQKTVEFKFMVIANHDPKLPLKAYDFIEWSEEREVEDLLNLHIGVMPLEQDEWSKGKCGFKAIQYLSLGIPAIATDIGVNNKVIEHGVSGFLCSTPDEWKNALEQLINDAHLRTDFGNAGRKHIESAYSVNAIRDKMLNVLGNKV